MAKKDLVINPQPAKIQTINMNLFGISSMISHKFSQKAMTKMMGVHLQLPPEPRKAKDPYADFLASLHFLPDGTTGMPGGAFKSCMVSSVRQLKGSGMNMTAVKQFFHVVDDLVRIHGDQPRMCQHAVRNESGVIDIRIRALYMRWSAVVEIEYDSELIKPEHLVVLANRGGFGVGIGDWRPGAKKSDNGTSGRFRVATTKDLVGPAHTEWCRKHPVDPVAFETAGGVSQELVDIYIAAAKLPPPPEQDQAAAPGKKSRKSAAADPDRQALLNQLKAQADTNPSRAFNVNGDGNSAADGDGNSAADDDA